MAGIEAFFEDVDEDDGVILGAEETVVVDDTTPPIVPEVEPEVIPPASETIVPELPASDTVPIPETEPPPVSEDHNSSTIASLRQMLQEQQQKIERLEGRSKGLTKALTESGHIDEESIESETESTISDSRIEILAVLQETMRLSPIYADIDEVCSQENFDLTVEALAKLAVAEEGGTLTDQIQNVSKYIWSRTNPYKFVYDIVKQNHPKYKTPPPTTVPAAAPRTPAAPPKSISSIPGGSPSHADGWTAAKIDALSEDELHTVPPTIYERYMRNDLE